MSQQQKETRALEVKLNPGKSRRDTDGPYTYKSGKITCVPCGIQMNFYMETYRYAGTHAFLFCSKCGLRFRLI